MSRSEGYDNHWSPEARQMMAGYVGTHPDNVKTYWRWAAKAGLEPHEPKPHPTTHTSSSSTHT